MHGASEIQSTTVPAFLTKLWTLVEDPATDEFIAWDVTGQSFHVFDQGRFAKEILPLYFKHSNIASFIRQLNMYGFRKVVGVEQGGLKVEKDDMEFTHMYFQRGHEELLEYIKRKVTNQIGGGKVEGIKVKNEDINKVLTEVRSMKGKQDNMTGKLENLRSENEALWREVASLRQKHSQQQQIVTRLIQFLITVVGSGRGIGTMKRKMPLMINDASQLQTSPKKAKFAHTAKLDGSSTGGSGTVLIQEVMEPATDPTTSLPATSLAYVTSPGEPESPQTSVPANVEGGTVYVSGDGQYLQMINPTPVSTVTPGVSTVKPGVANVTSGLSSTPAVQAAANTNVSAGQTIDATALTNPEDFADLLDLGLPVSLSQPALTSTVALSEARPKYSRQISTNRAEMSDHVDNLQTELDTLKDLMSSGASLNLDMNTLLGLFNPEAPLPQVPDVNLLSGDSFAQPGPSSSTKSIVGNELATYNPQDPDIETLFDLNDFASADPMDVSVVPDLNSDSSNMTLNTPLIRDTDPLEEVAPSTEEVD